MFPDMPWAIGGDQVDAARSAAQNIGLKRDIAGGRLFAFGYDACRLAIALRTGGIVSIDGLTGHLSVDAAHRVRRDLAWLQIHNGEPRVLP